MNTHLDLGFASIRVGHRNVDAELMDTLRARKTGLLGRPFILRLQAAQRRLGLPVFDGFFRNPEHLPGQRCIAVHPALVDGYEDLLSDQWRAWAQTVELEGTTDTTDLDNPEEDDPFTDDDADDDPFGED